MKLLLAVLPLLAVVSAASAQQRPDPLAELRRQTQEMERKAQAGKVATKAEPMDQSLERLLTDGWTIVSTGIGMGEPMTQLVLHMPRQSKWALCGLQFEEGRRLSDQPVSRCVALN